MNIGLLTSGGDAPGMNAFISNFVKECHKKKDTVYSVKFGFQGLIDNQIMPLSLKDIDNISHLGGSFIKSFRSPEFQTDKGFEKALKNLKKNSIDCLVILGGDGSLIGANILSKSGINVIFVPATIDNDLLYTDRALGFDSAVNCAVEYIDKTKQTMLSLNRVFICEVMGRRSPDIAEFCALATNASVLITEKEKFDLNDIVFKIKSALKHGEESPHIIVRENILDVYSLAKKLQNQLDIEVRACVLGYVQRGPSPSVYDRIYAKQLAELAQKLIIKKDFGKSLGILNNKVMFKPLQSSLLENNRS